MTITADDRVCLHCGTNLIDRRADADFCSKLCNSKYRYHQLGIKPSSSLRKAERRRAGRLNRPPCANGACGQPIPVDRLRAKYCSEKCQRTVDSMRKYQCDVNRKHLYGITPEQFDKLIRLQNGKCAICDAPKPSGRGNWHIDHDHESGNIRGLLCHHCNLMLGNAKDDATRLRAAAEYLERHKALEVDG
jgi:hypothetical protein